MLSHNPGPGEREGTKPGAPKDHLSVNTILSLAASLFSLIAAIVGIAAGIPIWFLALLGVFILLVIGLLVWRPLAHAVQSLKKRRAENRALRDLLSNWSDMCTRLHEQMDPSGDSFAYHLFSLNQSPSRVFGDNFAPHPARAQILLTDIRVSMNTSRNRRASAVAAIASLDWFFAIYNELYVKRPAERAAKGQDKLSLYELGELKKTWPRYQSLVEEHWDLCKKANEVLGLQLGVWVREMPAPF